MRRRDALAFVDAVRDILKSEGRFCLAEPGRDDAVWQWDGTHWRRIAVEAEVLAVAS
jgi:hypothetical protein